MAVSRHRVIESHDSVRNQRAGGVADHAGDRAVLNLRLCGHKNSGRDSDQQEKSKHGCSHSGDAKMSNAIVAMRLLMKFSPSKWCRSETSYPIRIGFEDPACSLRSEAHLQRAGKKSRRRELNRSEFALFRDCKDAIGRILDVELDAQTTPLLAKQIDSKVEVRNEVGRQSHAYFFALIVRKRGGRAAAVFKPRARPEAALVFTPSEPGGPGVNLIKSGRATLA